jgi:hypothetical protein
LALEPRKLSVIPSLLEAVSQSQAEGEGQSDSKALECGSFRLWEIVACIKSNVFISLARPNPNG